MHILDQKFTHNLTFTTSSCVECLTLRNSNSRIFNYFITGPLGILRYGSASLFYSNGLQFKIRDAMIQINNESIVLFSAKFLLCRLSVADDEFNFKTN